MEEKETKFNEALTLVRSELKNMNSRDHLNLPEKLTPKQKSRRPIGHNLPLVSFRNIHHSTSRVGRSYNGTTPRMNGA